jgi:GTPase
MPHEIKSYKEPFEFDVNENFMVPGVGIVVSGLLKAGTASTNKLVMLGSYFYYTFRTW